MAHQQQQTSTSSPPKHSSPHRNRCASQQHLATSGTQLMPTTQTLTTTTRKSTRRKKHTQCCRHQTQPQASSSSSSSHAAAARRSLVLRPRPSKCRRSCRLFSSSCRRRCCQVAINRVTTRVPSSCCIALLCLASVSLVFVFAMNVVVALADSSNNDVTADNNTIVVDIQAQLAKLNNGEQLLETQSKTTTTTMRRILDDDNRRRSHNSHHYQSHNHNHHQYHHYRRRGNHQRNSHTNTRTTTTTTTTMAAAPLAASSSSGFDSSFSSPPPHTSSKQSNSPHTTQTLASITRRRLEQASEPATPSNVPSSSCIHNNKLPCYINSPVKTGTTQQTHNAPSAPLQRLGKLKSHAPLIALHDTDTVRLPTITSNSIGDRRRQLRRQNRTLKVEAQFFVKQATIIKAHKSIENEATYIVRTSTSSLRSCLTECLITESCDTVTFQEASANSSSSPWHQNDERQQSTNHEAAASRVGDGFYLCYLFDCAKYGKFRCQFAEKSGYISAVTSEYSEELKSSIDYSCSRGVGCNALWQSSSTTKTTTTNNNEEEEESGMKVRTTTDATDLRPNDEDNNVGADSSSFDINAANDEETEGMAQQQTFDPSMLVQNPQSRQPYVVAAPYSKLLIDPTRLSANHHQLTSWHQSGISSIVISGREDSLIRSPTTGKNFASFLIAMTVGLAATTVLVFAVSHKMRTFQRKSLRKSTSCKSLLAQTCAEKLFSNLQLYSSS